MKRYILALVILLFSSTSRADVKWTSIDFQYRDGAFVTGYVFASLVDLAYKTPQSVNKETVGKKMALGLLGGLAIAIGHSSVDNNSIQFTDIVFGGLGGLTCTVIHF